MGLCLTTEWLIIYVSFIYLFFFILALFFCFIQHFENYSYAHARCVVAETFAADPICYRDFLCGYNANISSNHIGRSYSSFVFVCLVVESCFVHLCLFSLLRYLFYNNNNYICITLKKIFLHTFLVVCKKWQLFEYIFSTF